MDAVRKERADAFKVGFLFKLAQAGISPNVLFDLMKKADIVDPLVSGVVDVGKAAIPAAGAAGLSGLKALGTAGLGLPLVAGGVLGATESSLEAPTTKDIELLRQAELAAMYRRMATEVKARQRARMQER